MSDLYTDPIGTAEVAAAKIAALTGKPRHHVALVMGSGWIDAAILIWLVVTWIWERWERHVDKKEQAQTTSSPAFHR